MTATSLGNVYALRSTKPWMWRVMVIVILAVVDKRERKKETLKDMSVIIQLHSWFSERGFLSAQQLSQGDKSTKTLSVWCVCLCWATHWIYENEQTHCRVTQMTAIITQYSRTNRVRQNCCDVMLWKVENAPMGNSYCIFLLYVLLPRFVRY